MASWCVGNPGRGRKCNCARQPRARALPSFLQGHRLFIGAGGRHSHHCHEQPRQRGFHLARVTPRRSSSAGSRCCGTRQGIEAQGIDLHLTDAVRGLGRDAVCAEALRVTPTPATKPIIGTAGPTPASSSTPLMTTCGDPTKALSVSPSHPMCGSMDSTA